MHKAAFYNGEK